MLSAKIQALVMGMRIACSLNLHHLIVEGDSAIVTGWMTSNEPGLWRLANRIKEAHSFASMPVATDHKVKPCFGSLVWGGGISLVMRAS